MATLTAQILVGRAHPNHGGINPTHQLFFSENDRPAWILMPENVFGRGSAELDRTVWIPTVEHALEDGLLMITLHIVKDDAILNLAEKHFGNKGVDRAELYKDINESQLTELHERCRAVRGDLKIAVTTFKGSLLEQQLPILEKYKMDVEVCVPIYSRLYSQWNKRTNTEGSL
jgi:hypothetical protein